jgi:hypothetical protein
MVKHSVIPAPFPDPETASASPAQLTSFSISQGTWKLSSISFLNWVPA